MRRVKRIIAIVLAFVTISATPINASAGSGVKNILVDKNSGVTATVNLPGQCAYGHVDCNGIDCSRVDELSWSYLYNKKYYETEKMEDFFAGQDETIRIQVENYNTNGFGKYTNQVIAVLYEGCTLEEAIFWTSDMKFYKNNIRYGNEMLTELRYDHRSGLFYIVALGAIYDTFKNKADSLYNPRHYLYEYLVNAGILSVSLANADANGRFFTAWEDSHRVTGSEIRNYFQCDYSLNNVAGNQTYVNFVTFTRRLIGVKVKESLNKTYYDNVNKNISVQAYDIVDQDMGCCGTPVIQADGSIWTAWGTVQVADYIPGYTTYNKHDITIITAGEPVYIKTRVGINR